MRLTLIKIAGLGKVNRMQKMQEYRVRWEIRYRISNDQSWHLMRFIGKAEGGMHCRSCAVITLPLSEICSRADNETWLWSASHCIPELPPYRLEITTGNLLNIIHEGVEPDIHSYRRNPLLFSSTTNTQVTSPTRVLVPLLLKASGNRNCRCKWKRFIAMKHWTLFMYAIPNSWMHDLRSEKSEEITR